MKNFLVIGFLFSFLLNTNAQDEHQYRYQKTDTTEYLYMIIEGDTLPSQYITLDEVVLLNNSKFESEEARKQYLILRRRTRKVYPYAKLTAERLVSMNERLNTLDKKSQRKKYIKTVQKYLEEEFTDDLKNMTRSEGRILVKLVHRQTGSSVYDLIKEFRSGWRAFRYNTTAGFFDISLKSTYDPFNNQEDFLIEDILLRSFQEGVLEVQPPARPINYFDAASKWKK